MVENAKLSPQGWTVDTLKEYLHTLIVENDKRYRERFESGTMAVNAALAAAEKAVQKAEVASEKRFEGVNEFRQSLADIGRLQMPRAETEALIKVIDEKIAGITTRIDKAEGNRVGTTQGYGWVVGIIGFVIAVVTLLSQYFK